MINGDLYSQFRSCGQCQESYGYLLVPVVLEKVSGEICRQIARENSVNNWELGDLRRAINREIGILEAGTTHSDPGIDSRASMITYLGRLFTQERDPEKSTAGPKTVLWWESPES